LRIGHFSPKKTGPRRRLVHNRTYTGRDRRCYISLIQKVFFLLVISLVILYVLQLLLQALRSLIIFRQRRYNLNNFLFARIIIDWCRLLRLLSLVVSADISAI